MPTQRRQREADSPFVEQVTEVAYEEQTREWATPDGRWDIVVFKRRGVTTVLQTGAILRPVLLENAPGDTFLAISFKPGVFAPRTPGNEMIDRAVWRPVVSARSFAMETETLEIPTFDNVEQFVQRIARRDLIVRDELVDSVVRGQPRAATARSMQRHFLSAVGMTPKQFAQIQRACHAVELLRRGMTPAAVAAEAGYADQPHLTRALKAIMGQTPGELVRMRTR